MADNIQLDARKRNVTGKQVRQLRREGFVPAVLYGPDREPVSLEVEAHMLAYTLAEAGGSAIIDINIGGEAHPAIVRNVQRDFIRGDLLHVDFYAVSMDRPITADVPLEFVNEPALVKAGDAVLVTGATTVEVECLPADLPHSLQVDLSALVDFDSLISARDLVAPSGVAILTDPDEMIATLTHVAVEAEEEAVVEMDAEAVEVIRKGKEEVEEEEE